MLEVNCKWWAICLLYITSSTSTLQTSFKKTKLTGLCEKTSIIMKTLMVKMKYLCVRARARTHMLSSGHSGTKLQVVPYVPGFWDGWFLVLFAALGFLPFSLHFSHPVDESSMQCKLSFDLCIMMQCLVSQSKKVVCI